MPRGPTPTASAFDGAFAPGSLRSRRVPNDSSEDPARLSAAGPHTHGLSLRRRIRAGLAPLAQGPNDSSEDPARLSAGGTFSPYKVIAMSPDVLLAMFPVAQLPFL